MSFETGTPIHCIELNTGSNLTGTVLVSEETMRADIYNYAGFFFIKPEQPIFLRTATNDIVSLYSNISAGPGTASRLIDRAKETYQTTHHQEIVSNIVVVGHDRWNDTDKLKRVHFTVKYIDHLLRHRGKMKALSNSKFPKEEHFNLYRDAAEGMTLSAWYGATYGAELDSPKAVWPTFEIEFDEPMGIHEYETHVANYVFFLSFCLGVALAPRDIHIDRLSLDETKEGVSAHTYLGNHRVHYIWQEKIPKPRDITGFGSPVRAYDDKALAAFRACVVAWMNRAASWHKPYRLMMGSLALRHIISAERLISACRWLEDIPLARSHNTLPDSDVRAISKAASDKALKLGYDQAIQARIGNAVKWIKAETSEERFQRLVALVAEKFGRNIFPPNAVQHLTRAIRFRGKVAHGHFNPDDDVESRAFYKSMCAMEALCWLLTALELPIREEELEHISSHPLVEGYLHAYE